MSIWAPEICRADLFLNFPYAVGYSDALKKKNIKLSSLQVNRSFMDLHSKFFFFKLAFHDFLSS